MEDGSLDGEAVVTDVGVGAAWPPPGAEHLQLSMTLLTSESETGKSQLTYKSFRTLAVV